MVISTGLKFCIHFCIGSTLLGLYSKYERKHEKAFGFLDLTSLKMMFSSSIHLLADNKISFFFVAG
jgi:hypothetical protein